MKKNPFKIKTDIDINTLWGSVAGDTYRYLEESLKKLEVSNKQSVDVPVNLLSRTALLAHIDKIRIRLQKQEGYIGIKFTTRAIYDKKNNHISTRVFRIS